MSEGGGKGGGVDEKRGSDCTTYGRNHNHSHRHRHSVRNVRNVIITRPQVSETN